jgi:hypothetical protein
MNHFAADLMGLSPVFALVSFVLAGIVHTTPFSLLLAILAGSSEKTEMLAEHLVTQTASATTLCRDLRLGFGTIITALAKGITTLAIGTVVVPLAIVGMVCIAAYKAGEGMVNTTTNTYRQVRTSVKTRILNWLGVTEMVNELKRENAKLQYNVRRLEILADVNVEASVSTRQVEANEMAQALDAEFRTQLKELDRFALLQMWINLKDDPTAVCADKDEDIIEDIMAEMPMNRSTVYQQVVGQA